MLNIKQVENNMDMMLYISMWGSIMYAMIYMWLYVVRMKRLIYRQWNPRESHEFKCNMITRV